MCLFIFLSQFVLLENNLILKLNSFKALLLIVTCYLSLCFIWTVYFIDILEWYYPYYRKYVCSCHTYICYHFSISTTLLIYINIAQPFNAFRRITLYPIYFINVLFPEIILFAIFSFISKYFVFCIIF